MLHSKLLLSVSLISLVSAACYDPSPAFPVPLWENGAKELEPAFERIAQKLDKLASHKKYDTSSFSFELTSNTDTLWTHHHSARTHNATRPGVTHIDGDSIYRIASITKTFTTLALLYQHAAGKLSLDDPVSNYIAALNGPESGKIPWKDITLRIMASQLSGIPREWAQADLINEFPDPTKYGLPLVGKEGLPHCYQYTGYSPCTAEELLENLKGREPVFAPNAKSTYSNLNFELLGVVLENSTGMNYSEYIQSAIFEPLEMVSSSLSKPDSDDHAVLPVGQYFFDVDEGIHNPTGGIYSTSSDMSKYLRYILTHYNALATGVNWFLPSSWADGLNSFYGMPFEIFRTDRILSHSNRPVTFVTKSGGVPDYFSRITMLPEYGLGLTILTAGAQTLLAQIQEIVTVELVRAAEELIWQDVDKQYTGTYTSTSTSLNSSLTLSTSPSTGLLLDSFISNSTDVFTTLLPLYAASDNPWRAQLIPTLLFKNETTQQGEIWRLLVVPDRQVQGEDGKGERDVWDDFCITDVDAESYAGLPLNEFVFWRDEGVVELPAWRVSLQKADDDERNEEAGKNGESLLVTQT